MYFFQAYEIDMEYVLDKEEETDHFIPNHALEKM